MTKIKVNQLWYSKQIQWNNEAIEDAKRHLIALILRQKSMLAGFPSEHDIKQNVTLEMLNEWIEKAPLEIKKLHEEIETHKKTFQPCKKEVPNFNKFMSFWVENIDKLINYEMDYYNEYGKLIEACYIADNPDDEDCAEITEICEQIQILTGINDKVRFR